MVFTDRSACVRGAVTKQRYRYGEKACLCAAATGRYFMEGELLAGRVGGCEDVTSNGKKRGS